MYNVVIIGVGALGKRHLESVLKTSLPVKVYVVDSNKEAIDAVIDLNDERVLTSTDMEIVPKVTDVAIIATSSAVRRVVFEQLVSRTKVKNIIFEKVLFQRKEDYEVVKEILEEQNIRAWVNCSRRAMPFYKEVRELLQDCNRFTFQMNGGNWGLGCNGIHMLDLVAYLSQSTECNITNANYLPYIEDSKRIGYKEFYGTVAGNCGKCEAFTITCFKDSNLPLQISIIGDKLTCVISEATQKMFLRKSTDEWVEEEREITIPYQSQMTQGYIEKIIECGECDLTGYEESMKLHNVFMESLFDIFKEQGMEEGICPIT